MSKNLRRMLCTLLVMVLLGGCASVALAAEGGVTLNLWNYKAEIVDLLPSFYAEFTQENPAVTVESSRPGGTDYYPTISAYLSSGEYPDLICLNTQNKTKQYAEDYLLPLNDYDFISRFTDSARASVTFDGLTYTMPINAGCIGLLYNTRLFEAAGITGAPQTLSEFREACEKLKASGVQIPVALAAKDPETLQQIFSVVHTKTLGDDVRGWVDQMNAGTGSFANEQMDGVFMLLDMLKEFGPPDPFALVAADTYALYGQEQVGMMITGAWALTSASQINPEIGKYSRMSSVPISETPDDRLSAETSMGIGIIKQGKNIEACLKVLEWMSTQEGAARCAQQLNIFMPVAEDPTYPALGEQVWRDTSTYINDNRSYPWGYMIWITGLSSDIGAYMQEYFAGSITQEDFLKKCDEGWAKYVANTAQP